MKTNMFAAALLSASLAASALAGSSNAPNTPSFPQTLLTGADGSQYSCLSSATAASIAAVASGCRMLPPGLVDVAQAAQGRGVISKGLPVDPSQVSITVTTPNGTETCPVSAFSMSSDNKSKLLDASKCTASTSTTTPLVVCTSDATVSTTMLTCAVPTSTSVNNPLQPISGKCPGGGNRVVTGGYDSTTGKLDTTITLTGCKDPGDVQVDGTIVLQGTVVAGTGTSFTINDTKTISEKLTFHSGNTATRQCTITRAGTLDSSTHVFKGTITRTNCSLAGSVLMGGLIDFLADDGSFSSEEQEGPSGTSGD